MPYPAQVTPERIVSTAGDLIEQMGFDQVSLARLAQELGIKAPSLYKYFADKNALLKAINGDTIQALTHAMGDVVSSTPIPTEQLWAMAFAYRAYAHTHPKKYQLAFSQADHTTLPDPQILEALAIPLQQVWAQSVGMEQGLIALRGAWALVHGFVTLELGEKFQRGGNLDAVFEQCMRAYIAGWLNERFSP